MSESKENKSPRPILEFIIKTGLACFFVGFVIWAVRSSYIREPTPLPAYACINNLRQIDAAKQQWALENGKTNGDIVVTEKDIRPYLGRDPKCPSGGKYSIGKLNESPTCSLGTNVYPAHVLP